VQIIFVGIKKTMSEYTLPNGVYILNNGPKKKSVGGRFFNARTHEDIKKFFQHKSGIKFTSKPEKADYVLLPEGVREPGSKLRKRNPALADSRLWFSFDKISNSLYSKSYAKAHKLKKKKSSDSYEYVLNDVNSGRNKNVQIPNSIAPSGKAQFLLNNRKNPPYVTQFGNTYTSVYALDDTMPLQDALNIGAVETRQQSIPTTSTVDTLVARVNQQIQQLTVPTGQQMPISEAPSSFPAFRIQGVQEGPTMTGFMTQETTVPPPNIFGSATKNRFPEPPKLMAAAPNNAPVSIEPPPKKPSFVEDMNYLAAKIKFVTETLEGYHFGSQQAVDMALTYDKPPDQMKNVQSELRHLGEAFAMMNLIIEGITSSNAQFFTSQQYTIKPIDKNNLKFVNIFEKFQSEFDGLLEKGRRYITSKDDEFNKQNMVQLLSILRQLQIDMPILINSLRDFEGKYASKFEKDVQDSKNTTKCTRSSRVCKVTKDGGFFGSSEYDGEPAVDLMWSLSSSVCTLIRNLENELNPDKVLKLTEDFKSIEQRMDLLKDIRNYLYFQGYRGGGFVGSVFETPCTLTYTFQEDLITSAKSQKSDNLMNASFGQLLNELIQWKLDKLLTRFLSDGNNRQNNFVELKKAVDMQDQDDQKTIWIVCGIVSYIFFLRKYFSDPNNVQIISEIRLKECFASRKPKTKEELEDDRLYESFNV